MKSILFFVLIYSSMLCSIFAQSIDNYRQLKLEQSKIALSRKNFDIMKLIGEEIILAPVNYNKGNLFFYSRNSNDYKHDKKRPYDKCVFGEILKVIDIHKKKSSLTIVFEKGNDIICMYLPLHVKIGNVDDSFTSYLIYNPYEFKYNPFKIIRINDEDIQIPYYNARIINNLEETHKGKRFYINNTVKNPLELLNSNYYGFAAKTCYEFLGFSFVDVRLKNENSTTWDVQLTTKVLSANFSSNNITLNYYFLPEENDLLVCSIKNFGDYKGSPWTIKKGIFSSIYHRNFFNYISSLEYFFNNCIIEEQDYLMHNMTPALDSIRLHCVGKEVYGNECGYCIIESIDFDEIGDKTYKGWCVHMKNNMENKHYSVVLNNYFLNNYIPADVQRINDLQEQELEKQKLKEKIEKDKIEKERLLKKEKERENKLIQKYGKEQAYLILQGKVKIGFTKAMCIEAWGEPLDINRTITQYGIHEQWVYSLKHYLYFDGDKLTGIQD